MLEDLEISECHLDYTSSSNTVKKCKFKVGESVCGM